MITLKMVYQAYTSGLIEIVEPGVAQIGDTKFEFDRFMPFETPTLKDYLKDTPMIVIIQKLDKAFQLFYSEWDLFHDDYEKMESELRGHGVR